MKRSLLLPLAAVLFAASSCKEEPVKVAPPPVTDVRPLGDGLKVIGFALLGASVVLTLGRLFR
jgi:hypothetical protein